jgi:hypothetical protein
MSVNFDASGIDISTLFEPIRGTQKRPSLGFVGFPCGQDISDSFMSSGIPMLTSLFTTITTNILASNAISPWCSGFLIPPTVTKTIFLTVTDANGNPHATSTAVNVFTSSTASSVAFDINTQLTADGLNTYATAYPFGTGNILVVMGSFAGTSSYITASGSAVGPYNSSYSWQVGTSPFTAYGTNNTSFVDIGTLFQTKGYAPGTATRTTISSGSGTWNNPSDMTPNPGYIVYYINFACIGGGGGGGSAVFGQGAGGGGGGGGGLTLGTYFTNGTSLSYSVGGGGSAGATGSDGTDGNTSSFASQVAGGGHHGGFGGVGGGGGGGGLGGAGATASGGAGGNYTSNGGSTTAYTLPTFQSLLTITGASGGTGTPGNEGGGGGAGFNGGNGGTRIGGIIPIAPGGGGAGGSNGQNGANGTVIIYY